MKTCENCGGKIAPNAYKCPSCGTNTTSGKKKTTIKCRSCRARLNTSEIYYYGQGSVVNGNSTGARVKRPCPQCGERTPAFSDTFVGGTLGFIKVMAIIFGILGGLALLGNSGLF